MDDFPILNQPYKRDRDLKSIPVEIARIAYAEYQRQFGKGYQRFERIAERGGFAESELDMLYPGWREHLARLQQKD